MSESTATGDLVGLHPRLVVEGADAALEFYTAAFGGEVVERYTDGDGRVVHSMVVAGPVRFAVKDAGDGDPAPTDGGIPVIMSLDVSDADAVAARMRAGGATTIFELADHGYGAYGGRLRDPFGHQWMLSQPIEELTAEQTQARLDAMS
ncbi:VOC family protein [Pseudonocardia lacus]|uniref:VOC family protein n=1 Tax=Pseudonocardia lacus TaxID=2835865 RepID=UPI001BDC03C5|nr:VOC family protein [Pseudonocardia lacus]